VGRRTAPVLARESGRVSIGRVQRGPLRHPNPESQGKGRYATTSPVRNLPPKHRARIQEIETQLGPTVSRQGGATVEPTPLTLIRRVSIRGRVQLPKAKAIAAQVYSLFELLDRLHASEPAASARRSSGR
jgi:hypothetical protein